MLQEEEGRIADSISSCLNKSLRGGLPNGVDDEWTYRLMLEGSDKVFGKLEMIRGLQTAAVSYGMSQNQGKCQTDSFYARNHLGLQSSGFEQNSQKNVYCNVHLGGQTVHPQAAKRGSLNHQRIWVLRAVQKWGGEQPSYVVSNRRWT